MKPILSISIAAYNVENYIEKALKSLALPELDGKIEVLIVDDGSKDNTAERAIVFENMHPGIFKVVRKKNGGYGSTINTSIALASGKYFKQLDGDDWFNTADLVEFVNFLEKVDADYVLTNYLKVYEDEKALEELVTIDCMDPLKVYSFKDFDKNNDIAMHALTIKTKILKDNHISIDEHCFYTDVEYDLYPLPYVNSIVYIPLTIYCYRLGRAGQSMELKSSVRNYKDHQRVCCSLLLLLDSPIWKCAQDGDIKKKYIELRLKKMVVRQYFLYVLKKADKDIKEEYLQFNDFIEKRYPEWSKAASKEMTVKLSLLGKGILYPMVTTINNFRFKSKLE